MDRNKYGKNQSVNARTTQSSSDQILNYQGQAILLETETPSESPLPAWPQHIHSYQTDRVSQCQNQPLDTKLSGQLIKLS